MKILFLAAILLVSFSISGHGQTANDPFSQNPDSMTINELGLVGYWIGQTWDTNGKTPVEWHFHPNHRCFIRINDDSVHIQTVKWRVEGDTLFIDAGYGPKACPIHSRTPLLEFGIEGKWVTTLKQAAEWTANF